jgi:cell division septum initiation protein DivIVA
LEVVPLDPEQINLAGLPRDALSGYKAGPAEDLVKRVAWDYRQLVHERDKLKEEADALRRRAGEAEAELEALREELDRQRDPDEIARALLEAAQRRARELREAARSDSDATLKKARARARSIEEKARRRYEAAVRAESLGADVRRQLQAALDTILGSGDVETETATLAGPSTPHRTTAASS